MRLRIGQVFRRKAALLAVLLMAGGCAAPPTGDAAPAPEDAPMLVIPRIHHDAMRERAEAYCAQFGGEPELVDWRYRSTFGKRGEWRMQTMWECREAGE
jgi:hypothetical protein